MLRTAETPTPELPTPVPEFDLEAALAGPSNWPVALAAARDKADRSCFCPGGGGDWQPLLKLHHVCDTFLYADLCADGVVTAGSLRHYFENIADADDLRGELVFVEARDLYMGDDLQEMEKDMAEYLEAHHPARAAGYRETLLPLADKPRWGLEADLRYGVGDEARKIHMVFLQGEALAVYRGVYSAQRLAPQAVALPRQRGRLTRRSGHLLLNDLLGAVLREEPRPALMVAAQADAEALVGTSWPHHWSNLPGWGRAAFTQWPLPAQWWFDALQARF